MISKCVSHFVSAIGLHYNREAKWPPHGTAGAHCRSVKAKHNTSSGVIFDHILLLHKTNVVKMTIYGFSDSYVNQNNVKMSWKGIFVSMTLINLTENVWINPLWSDLLWNVFWHNCVLFYLQRCWNFRAFLLMEMFWAVVAFLHLLATVE